jgi:hypothetical protein
LLERFLATPKNVGTPCRLRNLCFQTTSARVRSADATQNYATTPLQAANDETFHTDIRERAVKAQFTAAACVRPQPIDDSGRLEPSPGSGRPDVCSSKLEAEACSFGLLSRA